MTNIIKNNSQAYGYKYASLSDIAEQGIEIPKMKTGTEEGIEYVFYYDTDLNEWIRGARVVIPENKSQNKAQQYASAITYARRVSTQMAKQLACTDDQDIEAEQPRATDKQIEYLTKLYSQDELNKITEYYQVANISDLPVDIVSQYISSGKQRNDEKKHNTQR